MVFALGFAFASCNVDDDFLVADVHGECEWLYRNIWMGELNAGCRVLRSSPIQSEDENAAARGEVTQARRP